MLSDDLQAFFDSYREAFNTLDAPAVARHYHVPSMLIDGDTCLIWTTEDQVLTNMRSLIEHYRSNGFGHASFETREIIQLHPDSAIVHISWAIDRTRDLAKKQFGTAYNLKRNEHGWRITVCTAYEERAPRH